MKKQKNRTLLWIICILVFIVPFIGSAQKVPKSKKLKTEPEYIIDLYAAFKNAKTYPLSLVAEEIEYIPLEKTKDCLLNDYLKNIFFDEKNILVFDFERCYRFNLEGKFINKIGKKGRGPGEYNRPMNIAVDDNKKVVYFQDHKRILKYNYDGEFLTEYQTEISSNNILRYDEGILLLNDQYYQHAEPGNRFSIRFFSEEKGTQIAKVDCPKKDKIPFAMDWPNMYNFDGKSFLRDYWDDTIFKIQNPLSIIPYATINKGKLKLRDNDDKSVFNGKKNSGEELVLEINFIAEVDRFIFLTTSKGLFCFDKRTKETRCVEIHKNGEKWQNFTNDLTGGPTFFPNNFPRLPVNNSTIVTFNHAYEFFEDGIDTNNTQIKELLKTLQPDDNPVLVLVKTKQ